MFASDLKKSKYVGPNKMKLGARYLDITYGDKPYIGCPRGMAEELCRRYNNDAKQLSIPGLGAGRGGFAAFADLGHRLSP